MVKTEVNQAESEQRNLLPLKGLSKPDHPALVIGLSTIPMAGREVGTGYESTCYSSQIERHVLTLNRSSTPKLPSASARYGPRWVGRSWRGGASSENQEDVGTREPSCGAAQSFGSKPS